jgi:hypothetical protein
MTTVPNQLIITINTSIPGFQKVKLNPSMIIKDVKGEDSTLYFDPLVKLKESVIQSTPIEIQKKQFFNKGLFQSLVNYTPGTRAKNLAQATREGYIDNNIRVTLDTLLNANSVIYIGKEPYVVAGLLWSKGEWKVDTKVKKEEVDRSKITDPRLYQVAVRDELISGEEQLKNLPSGLAYGSNYEKDPSDVARGVLEKKKLTEEKQKKAEEEKRKTDAAEKRKEEQKKREEEQKKREEEQKKREEEQKKRDEEQKKRDEEQKKKEEEQKKKEEMARRTREKAAKLLQMKEADRLKNEAERLRTEKERLEKEAEIIRQREAEENRNKMLMIENKLDLLLTNRAPSGQLLLENKEDGKDGLRVEELVTDKSNTSIGGLPSAEPPNPLVISDDKTFIETLTDLRNGKRFYYLLNTVFHESLPKIQQIINATLKLSTPVTVKLDAGNISVNGYAASLDTLKIVKNRGGGDCFFIAVADAINYHNYYHQKNRIFSGPPTNRVGTGNKFYTQLYLRELVYEFLLSWDQTETMYNVIGPSYVDDLNRRFQVDLETRRQMLIAGGLPDDITPEIYIDTANDVYVGSENFLVANVKAVPIDVAEYNTPFKMLPKNAGAIKAYILSNDYWANEVAIYALSAKLKLNIIPISVINADVPFFQMSMGNFKIQHNGWDKYMFLYHSPGHYETMYFKYTTLKPRNNTTKVVRGAPRETKTNLHFIFNKDDVNVLPPLFILFILYGAAYHPVEDDIKRDFTFFKPVMEAFEMSVNKICQNVVAYPQFFDTYTSYFNKAYKCPPFKPPKPSKVGALIGGAPTPYYRPYSPIAANMFKRDSAVDTSKLAYYVTIDLELHPGTSISPDEARTLKCNQKWNAIRKSYANFVGKPYIIPPIYRRKTVKNDPEASTGANITQTNKPPIQNTTRRIPQGGRRKYTQRNH